MWECSLQTTKGNIISTIEEMVDADSVIDVKLSTDNTVQVRTSKRIRDVVMDEDDYMWEQAGLELDDEATTG